MWLCAFLKNAHPLIVTLLIHEMLRAAAAVLFNFHINFMAQHFYINHAPLRHVQTYLKIKPTRLFMEKNLIVPWIIYYTF